MNPFLALQARPGQTPALAGVVDAPILGLNQMARYAGDPDFMMSLARGLLVLRTFGDARDALTTAEISRRTGLARAAARRCLYTLSLLGYVESTDRGFRLTPRMLEFGHAYLASTPLIQLAQPILDRVTAALGESSSLSVLDGDELLYVARSAAARIMSVALHVGSRLPAYCTSMGQVLLAHLPTSSLEDYLARVPLRAHTEHTVTGRMKFQKLLRRVREDGYALVDQQLEIGLRSIAVPVTDRSGVIVAALNASAHASRVDTAVLRTRFLPVLQQAATELGRMLPTHSPR